MALALVLCLSPASASSPYGYCRPQQPVVYTRSCRTLLLFASVLDRANAHHCFRLAEILGFILATVRHNHEVAHMAGASD
jgi:hypothetical protein